MAKIRSFLYEITDPQQQQHNNRSFRGTRQPERPMQPYKGVFGQLPKPSSPPVRDMAVEGEEGEEEEVRSKYGSWGTPNWFMVYDFTLRIYEAGVEARSLSRWHIGRWTVVMMWVEGNGCLKGNDQWLNDIFLIIIVPAGRPCETRCVNHTMDTMSTYTVVLKIQVGMPPCHKILSKTTSTIRNS